jgi:hypothetical protein
VAVSTGACTSKTPEKQESERVDALARSCVGILSARDPKADARTAYAAGDRRLLVFGVGSVTLEYMAPGIGCRAPEMLFKPYGLPDLPLNRMPSSDVLDVYEIGMQPCFDANHVYGAAFNLEMVRLAPEAIRRSCSIDSSGLMEEAGYADPKMETFMFPPERLPAERLTIEELMPPGTPPAMKWVPQNNAPPEAKPAK